MNKIITAINNKNLYEEILKNKNINLVNKNILYKEGIIEILEKNKEIKFIIISENIPGEIEINKLIEKIKEINKNIIILLIIEKEKRNMIKKENNLIIIEDKKDNIKMIEKIVNNKETINNKKIKRQEEIKILENKKIKIISIEGTPGCGKSIIATILSFLISKKNKKVLLIDFNIDEGNIHTILQIKKEENIIQKINNYFYFINIKQNNCQQNLFVENYDVIILDNYKDYLKTKIINEKIFLLEGNLIEIEKLKNKINKISENNDTIILNKYNKNSIDINIMKKFFNNKNIFKIKYNAKYNFLINNFKIEKNDKYFIKEYKKIIEKIFEI